MIKFIDMIENYTNYGPEAAPAGRMYHSSTATGGKGVEFTIVGQRYQTRGTVFSLSYWDANCVGREVTGGDYRQAAHASFQPQATVIAAEPFAKPEVVTVNIGDVLVCPALDLVVKIVDGGRWADPKAEILSCPAATVDYSELITELNARPKPYVSESWLSG